MSLADFREKCNEWFSVFNPTVICGDWQPLGNAGTDGRLTSTAYGADRTAGYVVAVERAVGNTATLWAATQGGRVFVSTNANADPALNVVFTRLDSLAPNDPNRFVSGIHIDPANPNRAWISYSGFDATTSTTPGHVFEVTYTPGAPGSATWVDVSHDIGDIPVTDVARDDVTGDLYAATDFGVFLLVSGTTDWVPAAPGMPNVEVGTHHRPECAQAVRRHARTQRLAAQPAEVTARSRIAGREIVAARRC